MHLTKCPSIVLMLFYSVVFDEPDSPAVDNKGSELTIKLHIYCIYKYILYINITYSFYRYLK